MRVPEEARSSSTHRSNRRNRARMAGKHPRTHARFSQTMPVTPSRGTNVALFFEAGGKRLHPYFCPIKEAEP